MFRRIKLGVYASLRNKVTFIAMLCLLICELMVMSDLNIKAEQERINYLINYDSTETNYWGNYWGGYIFDDYFLNVLKIGEDRYEKYDEMMKYLNKVLKEASSSLKKGNYLAFYPNNIKSNILLAETMEELQEEQKIETDDDFFKGMELLKDIKKKWNLPNYSIPLVLEEFDLWWAPQFISQVTYSYEMYERGINQLYTPSFLNGNTALYQFIANLFPIMILVLTVFLFYNQYEKDKRTGTIKNRMIQPQKRIFYLIEKMITNFIVILIVLAVPTLISNVLACLFYGVDFVNIPILAYLDGVTSFTSIPNTLVVGGDEIIRSLGLTVFSGFPTLEYNAPHLMLELMDFHIFMILVIGLLLLFILFNVILNQFITTIFRNPYLSLVVNLGITGICFGLISISDTSVLGMLNPYSYANPIVNLAGTSYYTYAMGVVVLSLYCVILFILSAVILRKKDVA